MKLKKFMAGLLAAALVCGTSGNYALPTTVPAKALNITEADITPQVIAKSGTEEILYGDANEDGEVNSVDRALYIEMLLGNATINTLNADVNLDNCIDAADLSALNCFLSGQIESLPTTGEEENWGVEPLVWEGPDDVELSDYYNRTEYVPMTFVLDTGYSAMYDDSNVITGCFSLYDYSYGDFYFYDLETSCGEIYYEKYENGDVRYVIVKDPNESFHQLELTMTICVEYMSGCMEIEMRNSELYNNYGQMQYVDISDTYASINAYVITTEAPQSRISCPSVTAAPGETVELAYTFSGKSNTYDYLEVYMEFSPYIEVLDVSAVGAEFSGNTAAFTQQVSAFSTSTVTFTVLISPDCPAGEYATNPKSVSGYAVLYPSIYSGKINVSGDPIESTTTSTTETTTTTTTTTTSTTETTTTTTETTTLMETTIYDALTITYPTVTATAGETADLVYEIGNHYVYGINYSGFGILELPEGFEVVDVTSSGDKSEVTYEMDGNILTFNLKFKNVCQLCITVNIPASAEAGDYELKFDQMAFGYNTTQVYCNSYGTAVLTVEETSETTTTETTTEPVETTTEPVETTTEPVETTTEPVETTTEPVETTTEPVETTTEPVETTTEPAEDDENLPQTGYPQWLGLLVAGAAVMTCTGFAAIQKSGVLKKKDESDEA